MGRDDNDSLQLNRMEIKLEKYQFIQEKLGKLKCSQGCQSNANYIVYQMGLLCTLCLSKLGDLPPDHLASLESLAKTIAELTDSYEKNHKQGTNLLPLKAEIEQQNKVIKPLRDCLTLDLKAIHSKTNQHLAHAHQHCLTQSRNQPLENFFEPDITASVLVNQSQLFLANLKNLKVVDQEGKISYVFRQPQKDPSQAKVHSLHQISSVESAVTDSHLKLKDIMARFRQSTKQNP